MIFFKSYSFLPTDSPEDPELKDRLCGLESRRYPLQVGEAWENQG